MTPQEELYEAYSQAHGTVLLEMLAICLRAHHGFTGRLDNRRQLMQLSDEHARAALQLLPKVISPSISHVVVIASVLADSGPGK